MHGKGVFCNLPARKGRRLNGRSPHCHPAFTLIELLVVVSITALLVAILVASLARARDQVKLAVCASNLRQVGLAIHMYAQESSGVIPHGPDPVSDYDYAASNCATNQIWIGSGSKDSTSSQWEYTGLGPLLFRHLTDEKSYYCPADDQFNLQEEMPKIGTGDNAYGSYIYRQLDQLPEGTNPGRLDSLGTNWVAERQVPVEALALDANSLGPAEYRHTNHKARVANILFRDVSAASFKNVNNALALSESVFEDWSSLPGALDQLMVNADFGYRGLPQHAPLIKSSKPGECSGKNGKNK